MPSLSRVHSAVRRLAAASPEARRFAVRAWLVAPFVEASLAWLGLAGTLRWVEAVPSRPRVSVDAPTGERLVSAAYRRHLLRGACLPRSLTQYLLHRRDARAVRFVVGVRRGEHGSLGAHAWVEEPGAASGGFASILTRTSVEVPP